MKVAGLLTNGGDTCSLNALLRHSRDALRDEGFTKIYGFEDGYRGLITGSYQDISHAHIDPLSGGTFLRSIRDSPTCPPSEQSRRDLMALDEQQRRSVLWDAKLRGALNTLEELRLDVLVVLGGNGTISATVDFAHHVPMRHKIICLPRTIDNDVNTYTTHVFRGREIKTALSPGYPSAAQKIVMATRNLRATTSSTRRIFTIETMGRDAGWLALAAALGWAEVITIPEVNLVGNKDTNEEHKELLRREGRSFPQTEVPVETLTRLVSEWYERGETRNVIIGVSEGTMLDSQQITMTQYGPRKLGGAGDAINEILMRYIDDTGAMVRRVYPNVVPHDVSCEIVEVPQVRCQHSDYDPRMGTPSSYDIELARILAYDKLRMMLRDEEFGRMPVLDQVLTETDLRDVGVRGTKTVAITDVDQLWLPVEQYYDIERLTSTRAFDDFLFRIVGDGLTRLG